MIKRNYLYWIMVLLLSIATGSMLTYLLIRTSIDWNWAVYFNNHEFWVYAASPFVILGMIVPLLLPLYYFVTFKRSHARNAYLQYKRALLTFVTSYILMSLLKVFTNRIDMEPFEPIGAIDISDQFRFGFMNSNSWWESFSEGWPSGHTMIAISMAIAINPLIERVQLKWLNWIYAILVSISVSTAFHWLSDIIAGGLIGVVIGLFYARYEVNEQRLPK